MMRSDFDLAGLAAVYFALALFAVVKCIAIVGVCFLVYSLLAPLLPFAVPLGIGMMIVAVVWCGVTNAREALS